MFFFVVKWSNLKIQFYGFPFIFFTFCVKIFNLFFYSRRSIKMKWYKSTIQWNVANTLIATPRKASAASVVVVVVDDDDDVRLTALSPKSRICLDHVSVSRLNWLGLCLNCSQNRSEFWTSSSEPSSACWFSYISLHLADTLVSDKKLLES